MTAVAVLLLLAAVLTFLCLTPLDISLQAERSRTFSSHIRAAWLFGLIEKRFRVGGKPRSAKFLEKTPKETEARQGTPPRTRKDGGKRGSYTVWSARVLHSSCGI